MPIDNFKEKSLPGRYKMLKGKAQNSGTSATPSMEPKPRFPMAERSEGRSFLQKIKFPKPKVFGQLLVFILLSHLGICGAAVSRFKNKTHIICETNSDTSLLFFYPPVEEEAKNTTTLVTNDKLFHSAWALNNSTNLELGPVTDKRWEDFETIHTDYHEFPHLSKSVSFSLFSPDHVEFFLDEVDGHKLHVYKRNVTIKNAWVDYTILLKDGKGYIFENSVLINQSAENLNPTRVIIKTFEKLYWKLHNYQVRTSNLVSDGPETIDLPPNSASCWMLRMALCRHCQLEVNLLNGISKNFSGKSNSHIHSWQQLEINSTRILLNKRTINNREGGHWTIDITDCPSLELGIKAYTNTEFNKICEALPQDVKSMPLRTTKSSQICKPGNLGQTCDVRCAYIFGSNRPFPWGYNEESCDQLCRNGTWGLSCNNNCTGCSNCNKITGTCKNRSESVLGSFYLLLLLYYLIVIMG